MERLLRPSKQVVEAASFDEAYQFRRPTSKAPFPFTEIQYSRILRLKSSVQNGDPKFAADFPNPTAFLRFVSIPS